MILIGVCVIVGVSTGVGVSVGVSVTVGVSTGVGVSVAVAVTVAVPATSCTVTWPSWPDTGPTNIASGSCASSLVLTSAYTPGEAPFRMSKRHV